jgi:transposase
VRIVGLDIHRVFAEAVMLDDGKVVRLGRIGMTREHLEAFARTLTHDDHVVVEATGNAAAVAEVLAPHVGRVAIANPRQVRLIAEARVKTDVIDATVLARLYASGFRPEAGPRSGCRTSAPSRCGGRSPGATRSSASAPG